MYNKLFTIYGLTDSRSPDCIRYVGKTVHPDRRLKHQLALAIRGGRTYRSCWIRSVLSAGAAIRQITLGTATLESKANAIEREQIKRLRDSGATLTNLTDGGEGTLGWLATPSTRAKMSRAAIGKKKPPRSSSHREAIRQSKLGHKMPTTTRAAIHAANTGRSPTAETREKMAAAKRGRKFSDEHRQRLSEVRTGRKFGPFTEEHRRKISESCRRTKGGYQNLQ